MKILNLKSVHGPNVYHHRPVVIMRVDLGAWTDTASDEIEGFVESLLALLPKLGEHACSEGHRGGFLERLQRGTYPAHIIEHAALEISSLAGIGVSFGKTRYAGTPGHYDIVTRFLNEEGMKLCLQEAFALVRSLLEKSPFDLPAAILKIQKTVSTTQLGPSTEAIVKAAGRRGIPCRRRGGQSLVELGYGKNLRKIQAAVTDATSLIGYELVKDKQLTKDYLATAGIPFPTGRVVREQEDLTEVFQSLCPPLVTKPLDGHHGKGVSLQLQTLPELLAAFLSAKMFCEEVLVEEMASGRDYRLLLVDGKLVAAAERKPPLVWGDGTKTLRELIFDLNQDPRRGEGHSALLSLIEIDEILLATVKKQNLTLETVVPLGQEVLLRANANLSSGGTARDVTEEVHPEVRLMAERIARLTDLDICGIDVIHSDISRPPEEGLQVLEVNAGPGLRMHLAPSEGRARPVGDAIVEMLYPPGREARIPIAAVTGTNGKTTTVRILEHILCEAGLCVGRTSTDGIWIGKEKIQSGDTSGPQSALTVLTDPKVETAVLEVARGGLLRGGLAYDWSDVGIITNIRADHLGQDGIEDISDLVWIKSLVAERVKEHGSVVLNADDEESAALAQSPRVSDRPREIFLFSVDGTSPRFIEHRARNQSCCWVKEGQIFLARKGRIQNLGSIAEIPLSMGGTARFQISNILAALGGAVGLGLPLQTILRALRSFSPVMGNGGRGNLYKIREAYVLLDYGHNPDALQAIGEWVSAFEFRKKKALLGIPGDRDTGLVLETGLKAAAYFDELFVRDDRDLRGRRPGEVPFLVKTAVQMAHPEKPVTVVEEETETLRQCLKELKARDLLVVFYETLEPVLEVLRSFDPVPVERVEAPQKPSSAEKLPPRGREVPAQERVLE